MTVRDCAREAEGGQMPFLKTEEASDPHSIAHLDSADLNSSRFGDNHEDEVTSLLEPKRQLSFAMAAVAARIA
jgi:hypothetical protein